MSIIVEGGCGAFRPLGLATPMQLSIPTATRVSPLRPPVPQRPPKPTVARAGHEHFVQFYESDEFLVTSVGQYLAAGLRENSAVVAIATSSHLQGLSAYLSNIGFDVVAQAAVGRYVPLDAAETLQKFMVGGVPNAAAFEQHIGSRVASLTANGRSLRAFGEMVALLWAEGNIEGAIRLEELWNALALRHSFELFCAYPIKGFGSDASQRPFLHICQAHSRVLPAETFAAPASTDDANLRAIAILQQKAAALETEVVERQRTEERLRRREAELTNLLENTSIGIHWVDESGIVVWANAAELSLLGYSAEEYIGQDIRKFHVDQARITDILARLKRGERLTNQEALLRCKDGTLRTVLIDSNALWDGDRFVHTQCFTRDVTGERFAEEASQHLAAIVESSDDAILSKNLDGIILSWNKGAERIFGYTPDEVIGQPITILIPPDRLGEEPQILAQLRRGERIDHFETVRRRKDGTLLDISVTVSPMRDSSGRIVAASKVARDISDRRRIEKALEAAREELTHANEELEQRVQERTASLREAVAQMEEFSYTVSHDLRAPLRGMQVYSQALLEDYGSTLDPEARHFLARIAENAARLDKMVTDVLTFSRVSRAEVQLQTIPLDKLVRDVIQQYPAMQPPRAVIDVAGLHPVHGHEPSMIQIISNLLNNSVKFVAPGVTPHVRVWTEVAADHVRLFVRDNGIGIKPAHHQRLFRMFERVHPDLPYEGTGVGLAIVRKAANRMGGDVGLMSDGSTGTLFWVQLPAAKGTT
jgi:PAS domain S-box-containing protein